MEEGKVILSRHKQHTTQNTILMVYCMGADEMNQINCTVWTQRVMTSQLSESKLEAMAKARGYLEASF